MESDFFKQLGKTVAAATRIGQKADKNGFDKFMRS